MFDVSIVLNLHNEASYLRRTMRSLEESVRFAKRYDICFELVVVLDRPDAATKDWIDRYVFEAFDGHQVIEVSNGSLGLSRNDGIEIARGEYIGTADGDDLISFNFFAEHFHTIKRIGPKTIVIPHYLLAFGVRSYFWEYFGSDLVNPVYLFDCHPYISRIFGERALFRQVRYVETKLADGHTSEDWHLNCEALVAGYRFATAPKTILFYRQRHDSLLQTSNAGRRIIPAGRFFRPTEFLKLVDPNRSLDSSRPRPKPDWHEIQERVRKSSLLFDLTRAANAIDSSVDWKPFVSGPCGSNAPDSSGAGQCYAQLCKLVGARTFTDVVLFPFLTTGGADKYILQVLNGLHKLDPSRSFLMLCGERISAHAWVEKLPDAALFVDLHRLCEGLDGEALETISLRIIQATARTATIHIKSSPFANGFIRRHSWYLTRNKLVFYYFSDKIVDHSGLRFQEGFNFDFISELAARLDCIISDHAGVLTSLTETIDTPALNCHRLYAHCKLGGPPFQGVHQPFKGVASWYLPSYLGWRRAIERLGENFTPERCLQAAYRCGST